MNSLICGTVKNCGPYLNKVIENMIKIGSLFNDYKIIIFYDHSIDNSLKILKLLKSKYPEKILLYINNKPLSKFRTHNLAYARNFCLNYALQKKDYYTYFIMMDCDDVNCKEIKLNILEKYLKRSDWDGLSFNSNPRYYDIWSLSIYPFNFSYNHFKNNYTYHKIIGNYINNLLDKCREKENKLLNCSSSFNGFSIYRLEKFINCYYDGRIRLDLISRENLEIQKNITKSNLVFKKYQTVDGRYEDCEHRAFHFQAINKNNAKIRISPEILFI